MNDRTFEAVLRYADGIRFVKIFGQSAGDVAVNIRAAMVAGKMTAHQLVRVIDPEAPTPKPKQTDAELEAEVRAA